MVFERNISGNVLPPDKVSLSRRQKRTLERAIKNADKERTAPTIGLTSEQEILTQEDDLPFLINEVRLHQSAQTYTLMEIRAYNALNRLGVTDADCKKFLLEFDGAKDLTTSKVYEQINKENREGMIDMVTALTSMRRQQKRYYDPDEADIINDLIEDNHISVKDILIEIKRARGESIDLMNLQIEWLKEKRALELKQTRIDQQADNVTTQSLATPQSVPEESSEGKIDLKQKVEEPFLLKGWRLFITRSPWSSDPQQLKHISTDSRQETLGEVTKLTQGKASIKPNSILNALEFHLRKDIIQRALAARNKYGPDGIKDWVKIKRGGDRIFFLIPKSDEMRAIFFIEGRDVVYR